MGDKPDYDDVTPSYRSPASPPPPYQQQPEGAYGDGTGCGLPPDNRSNVIQVNTQNQGLGAFGADNDTSNQQVAAQYNEAAEMFMKAAQNRMQTAQAEKNILLNRTNGSDYDG